MNTHDIEQDIRDLRGGSLFLFIALVAAFILLMASVIGQSRRIDANTESIDSINLRLQNYGIATGLVEEPSHD